MHLKTCAFGTIILAFTYMELGVISAKQNRCDEARSMLFEALSIMNALKNGAPDAVYIELFKR